MTEQSYRLTFTDGHRSELDRTLGELMENARRVLETQGRLRSLLRAGQAVVEQLELPVVLRRIVDAAVELVGARYGALGVIARDGHLEQFIQVGIPEDDAARMGPLPHGDGLLRALGSEQRPIRVKNLTRDPRFTGFPEHHPAMESFVGVPLRVRGEVFGNLYLADAEAGEFTAEDEELLISLAATAGTAIDNARLFDETQRRQRWSSALADVTAALLSDPPHSPLDLLVDRVLALAQADLVALVRAVSAESMVVDRATGPLADGVAGLVFAAAGTITGRALETGQPVVVPLSEGTRERPLMLGPTMVIPMITARSPLGALVVSRRPGSREFTARDVELAAEFATQASVALELAAAREDQQRLLVLEDRSRIARDLHDHVIQRLFAAGLSLQLTAAKVADPDTQARIADQVQSLDEAIVAIRTAIFTLTSEPEERPPLRHRVIGLLTELAGLFDASPRLVIAGPVDLAVPDDVADDVLAALREGLTNVARHARAREVTVALTVEGDGLTLEITDDGVGIGDTGRRSGIANLERRAARRGGTARVERRAEGGTKLTWRARLDVRSTGEGTDDPGIPAR
ncbi:GAF domain-containing protein [Lysobacter korlensis]|uniref:GAF domain-containing protein n=1 Tax=Lysobacter korlensis TaxID=553636 RepID=A0ABV6RP10_9GAMM